MVTAWPARGQQAPNYWDQQLKSWIEEAPAVAGAFRDALDLRIAADTNLGSKADLVAGKVPAAQLPSYVDDVLEYANLGAFPGTGEANKIYVAVDTNLPYRWTGSAYVAISSSVALGETSSTAYRGDRGKVAYDLANLSVTRAITSVVSGATPTPGMAGIGHHLYSITALALDVVFGAPTGTPQDPSTLVIMVKDNGTARALGWNAAYRAITNGPALPTTTIVGQTLWLTFRWNASAAKWDLVASSDLSHTHTAAQITDLSSVLSGYAVDNDDIVRSSDTDNVNLLLQPGSTPVNPGDVKIVTYVPAKSLFRYQGDGTTQVHGTGDALNAKKAIYDITLAPADLAVGDILHLRGNFLWYNTAGGTLSPIFTIELDGQTLANYTRADAQGANKKGIRFDLFIHLLSFTKVSGEGIMTFGDGNLADGAGNGSAQGWVPQAVNKTVSDLSSAGRHLTVNATVPAAGSATLGTFKNLASLIRHR